MIVHDFGALVQAFERRSCADVGILGFLFRVRLQGADFS